MKPARFRLLRGPQSRRTWGGDRKGGAGSGAQGAPGVGGPEGSGVGAGATAMAQGEGAQHNSRRVLQQEEEHAARDGCLPWRRVNRGERRPRAPPRPVHAGPRRRRVRGPGLGQAGVYRMPASLLRRRHFSHRAFCGGS